MLLATVSILTLLSGIIVFFGSSKGYKVRSFWFLLSTIFATLWSVAISQFLIATPDWGGAVEWPVRLTFISAILLDLAFLAYVSWHQSYGRVVTLFYTIFGLIISGFIALKPELLYSEIVLANTGNSVSINVGPLYLSYVIFFATIVPAVITALVRHYIEKIKSKKKSKGDIIIMLSFAASSTITLIADLILPLTGNWLCIWLGPLALSATIIGFYYTILRYSTLNLNSIWLRIFSYIVIIASLAIVYMLIFAALFAGMFRGATPSTEVIVLNFVMIMIVLILMPAVNELSNFIKSLITSKKKED
jgi:hypothetical protein